MIFFRCRVNLFLQHIALTYIMSLLIPLFNCFYIHYFVAILCLYAIYLRSFSFSRHLSYSCFFSSPFLHTYTLCIVCNHCQILTRLSPLYNPGRPFSLSRVFFLLMEDICLKLPLPLKIALVLALVFSTILSTLSHPHLTLSFIPSLYDNL